MYNISKYGPGATFNVDPDTLHGQRAIENAALICHEANRGYCASLGDESQVPWLEAPGWQRGSAIDGVKKLLATPDAKPGDSHRSWMEHKLAEGWTYGDVKDPTSKTHPSMRLFEDLSPAEQGKDVLFLATARAALSAYRARFACHQWHEISPGSSRWRCTMPEFDLGMMVAAGRANRIAAQACAELARFRGESTLHPDRARGLVNRELAHQVAITMLSETARLAYDTYAANRWPDRTPKWLSWMQHWYVMHAISHAVMELEGVVIQRWSTAHWEAAWEHTGTQVMEIRVSGDGVDVGTPIVGGDR